MRLRKMAAVMGAVVLAASSIGLGSTLQNAAPASAAGDIVFNPTADTYVQADRPTENFGTSVRWSTEGRADIWRNALLRFNVQAPAGEHIVSAKLRAYSEASAASTEFVDVYGTAGTWTETGATWENAPARGTWLGKTGNFASGSWVEWDVTNWVGDGGYTNFKLESNALKWIGFSSREAQDPTRKPQLVVTTEADTVTPPPPVEGDGTTAAATFNWGTPVAGDEFNYTGAPDSTKWSVYDSAGHAGNGLRSPAQATVNGTALNIDGTADGTTAGMSAKFANQKYGRWETRAKASGDDEYHMVSILWPDSGNWPCDGEIDYAETTGSFSAVHFFQHYSCSNTQTQTSKAVDVTQWHNYAVDWSPTGMVGYIDGVKWFEDNDPTHQPPGSMHQTLQLDWFPDSTADGTGNMQVDWVRVYPAASTDPTPDPDPTDPPATGTWKFSAVGDMNPSGTTSATSDSGKNATSIKNELAAGEIDNFLALGDFQYSIGNCQMTAGVTNPTSDDYSKWNANWGPLKSKIYWMAGPNHDYQPGRNEDLGKFMNGECVSTTKSATNTELGRYQNPLEWYAFDKGNWHVLVAPTAVWRYNTTRANAMTSEMDADLAAAKARGQHLLVMYHDPYFTSPTDSHDREYDVKPWINVFDKNGVRILLSGSQHNYERSCYVTKDDVCKTDGTGMQQFQVSTGGIGLRAFKYSTAPSFIEKRFTGTWGHLKMELHDDGSYSWQYVPTSGVMTNTDSGSRPAP